MELLTELARANVEPMGEATHIFREEVFQQPLSPEMESLDANLENLGFPGLRLVAQVTDGEVEAVEEYEESDLFAIDPELKKAHEMMDLTVKHLKAGDWQSASRDFFQTQKCYEKYYNNNPTTDPVELENRRRSNQETILR